MEEREMIGKTAIATGVLVLISSLASAQILSETFDADPGVVFDPTAQVTNQVAWNTWVGAHDGDCAYNVGQLKMVTKNGGTRGWAIALDKSNFPDQKRGYRLTYHYKTLANASNNYVNVGIWEADIGSGGTANHYEIDTYGGIDVWPALNKAGDASKTKIGNWLTSTGAVSTTEVVIDFTVSGTNDVVLAFANVSATGSKGTVYLEDVVLEQRSPLSETFDSNPGVVYGPKPGVTNDVNWDTWVGATSDECAYNEGRLKVANHNNGGTRGWSIALNESHFTDETKEYRLTYSYSTLGNASNNFFNVGVWEANIGSGGASNDYELDTYAGVGQGPAVNLNGDASRTKIGNWLTSTGAVSTTEVVIDFTASGTNDIVVAFANVSATGSKGTLYIEDFLLEEKPEDPPVLDAYGTWSNEYSLVYGPDGDDDGDGLNNLYEYGLGGNPTNGAVDGNLPTFGAGSSGFDYVHALRTNDASLIYYLELTDDLVGGTWTNIGYSVSGTNVTGGEFDFVTNSILTTNDQSFIKLIIEQ
jgi:acyl-coenzyme A thioesterase PaaI-like protein